jgi:hypothetical protein
VCGRSARSQGGKSREYATELVCGNRWVANTERSQGREFGASIRSALCVRLLLSVVGRHGAAAIVAIPAGERRPGTCIYDETRELDIMSLFVVPTCRNSRR